VNQTVGVAQNNSLLFGVNESIVGAFESNIFALPGVHFGVSLSNHTLLSAVYQFQAVNQFQGTFFLSIALGISLFHAG
jgi:hypothetical protein